MKVKKFCIYELIDKLFWIALALFPLIGYLVSCHQSQNVVDFENYLASIVMVDIGDQNLFGNALSMIFGTDNGFFNMIADPGVFIVPYFSYLFVLEFLHVMLDVILFLPRWCHTFMRRYDYEKDKN